jgi:hypothetical protein
MAKYTKEKLYELLPAIYRQRDAEVGKPLEALLGVIAEQIDILEEDIEKLYNNWFIETCDEWVVPYIADLIGAKVVHSVSMATFSQRAWVANTLAYRRRKGTLSMLEQLARDLTGWNVRAVEFFQLLETTQYLNHLRPTNLRTPDLRNTDTLDLLDTPFDTIAHTIDVRRIDSTRGYYNIPNIGLFLWRLQAYPVINAPAFNHGNGKFSFHQLGYDIPLYNHPESETSIAHIAEEINISAPIRRRALYSNLKDYYYTKEGGEVHDKSIKIQVNDAIKNIDDIVICDLSDWQRRRPSPGKVAIDPVLGRILFPSSEDPLKVYVSYYYGFSSEVGGGFYQRPLLNESDFFTSQRKRYLISKKSGEISTIKEAVDVWEEEVDRNQDAIFEIMDSEFYQEEEPIELKLPEKITLEIRSSQKQRPVLRLRYPIKITGAKDSNIILDGLVIDTTAEEVNNDNTNNNLISLKRGDLHKLLIRHCTLVPERNSNSHDDDKLLFVWDNIPSKESDNKKLKDFLKRNFDADWVESQNFIKSPDNNTISISNGTNSFSIRLDKENMKAVLTADNNNDNAIYEFVLRKDNNNKLIIYNSKISLLLNGGGNDNLNILLTRTIIGRIYMTNSEAKLEVIDSIIDGKGSLDTLTCYNLKSEGSTIFGKVNVSILELASNTIFTDTVLSNRLQVGCMRFCHVPDGSHAPRRYRCQPDYPPRISQSEKTAIALKMRPRFTSEVYGEPGYGQLHKDIPKEIFEGADNQGEMGVFNHLYQAQRINNLKSSFDEYMRFGLEAGIFLVT